MNIISNFAKDTKTEKKKSGSYEWWYFDAQSANGYKIVVIFYEGNPFSRRYIHALEKGKHPKADQFPALSISVYKNSAPVFYSFCEVEPHSAEFSADAPFGRIGKNQFQGKSDQTHLEYIVDLDQKLATGDSIRAKLSFDCNIQSLPDFSGSKSASDSHIWNLLMPSATVSGTISINGSRKIETEFFGPGYHDHNTGSEPLKNSFQEWYWGRYHLENSTFIYYLMNKKGSWEKNAWLISREGEMQKLREVEMSNKEWSLFGLKTARILEARNGSDDFFLQLDRTLDSGPFYQRFSGRLLAKSGSNIVETRGISEYMQPKKIHQKLFWPIVNMRIAYPGKTHWVQRNPYLYRWTW